MELAPYIDHTMLKADATGATIKQYCDEAKKEGFASVCVNTCHVPLVHKELENSSVRTCCVVGFPLGAMATASKAFEARQAVADGADEVDMVINIGWLKDRNYDLVKADIKSVAEASRPAIVKVIIETCLLTTDEKIKACELSLESGADFVKTSTGFSTGGATVEDITLMRHTVETRAQIKASGGIRTKKDAISLIEAGADRIGAGNGMLLI